ncbi:delta-60 repeat domain-containing protein [Luminiphilus sp.]|nr:delta-60 repeat domain-containing protein [Luminiphilus sp.]
MIHQCFSRLRSMTLSCTLLAVAFSLLTIVGAKPVAAAAGDLDTTFGTDGKVTTDFNGLTDEARSVAIQSDGKLVVAGISIEGSQIDESSFWRFALARYNVNGSLDTSFGGGGKVTTAIGGYIDEAYSVAIQSDGKIVGAGTSLIGLNDVFALVRYNTDGTLDNSFDSDGKVTTEHGSGSGYAYSVAIQSDDKIVAAGYVADAGFALVRYNTDGALDNSFGTDGKVYAGFDPARDSVAYSVAIQSDGKIVAAGWSENGSNTDFALARYSSDGTLDNSFDSDGKVTTAIGSGKDIARSVAIQSNGKIVAAGWSENGSNTDFALARYSSDGTLDNSFDSDGKVTSAIGSGKEIARSVAIQSNGNVVAVGWSSSAGYSSNSDFALLRYVGIALPVLPIDPAVLWFITRGTQVEEEE